MIGQEILIEIDATLDQLIRNAEVIQNVNIQELSVEEVEAFQKTQESLIHHLLHMDRCFEAKKQDLSIPNKKGSTYQIQEKRRKFEQLASAYHETIKKTQNISSILSKRRSKRFLSLDVRKN
jgi:hypothetical protein